MELDKTALRAAVAAVAPWTSDTDVGPRAVDAGECDRCRRQPRFVATCGAQQWPWVCRDCLLEGGLDLFCAGHENDALRHMRTARALPDDWDTITRIAWIATGEVTADEAFVTLLAARTTRRALAASLRG